MTTCCGSVTDIALAGIATSLGADVSGMRLARARAANVHPDNALMSVAGEVGCRGLTVVPPGPEIDGHFIRMSDQFYAPSNNNTTRGWGEYRLRLIPPLSFSDTYTNTYNTSLGGYRHELLSGTFDITLSDGGDKLGFLKLAVVRANTITTPGARCKIQELANVATANLVQSYGIINADRSTLEIRANVQCRMAWRFEGFLSGYDTAFNRAPPTPLLP